MTTRALTELQLSQIEHLASLGVISDPCELRELLEAPDVPSLESLADRELRRLEAVK